MYTRFYLCKDWLIDEDEQNLKKGIRLKCYRNHALSTILCLANIFPLYIDYMGKYFEIESPFPGFHGLHPPSRILFSCGI